MDIFYINGNAFIHTKSKTLNYITINKIKNRRKETILRRLRPIITLYLTKVFLITDIYADNEFDSEEYRELFLPTRMHRCAKGEHVPIIERTVRTFKEHYRSICHGVPYKKYPKLMVHA